jgi:uncharacterized membrane protein YqjE
MGSSLGAFAGERAALFALELRQEARRGSELLVLAAVAAVMLQLCLLMVAVFVVAVFWDTHRLIAMGGMGLLYGSCAAAIFLRLKNRAAGLANAFPATREEFRQDLERMGSAVVGARSSVTRIATWMRRGLLAARLSLAVAGFLSACVRDRTDRAPRRAHAGRSTGEQL